MIKLTKLTEKNLYLYEPECTHIYLDSLDLPPEEIIENVKKDKYELVKRVFEDEYRIVKVNYKIVIHPDIKNVKQMFAQYTLEKTAI